MPRFNIQSRDNTVARGVYTLRKGIGFLQASNFDSALREFRKVMSSRNPRTSRLVKSVASFYSYNTYRLQKEHKKAKIGNGNLMDFLPGNRGDAWSDVDIAAVLVAPNNRFTTQFLARFLGRTVEGIRFHRRYTSSNPLRSWKNETGSKYTRYTQNQRVARKLGA